MLPERLSAYLTYLEHLTTQPANRWEGFDLRAPDVRESSLGSQICFVGCALAALATHPDAGPDEQTRARDALPAAIERMAQRRVWAAWAQETERRGRLPDPVGEPNAGYSGPLTMLVGLYERAGGDGRYSEPLALHWSSGARFAYAFVDLAETLWRQARANRDGAVASADDLAYPHDMAHVIWALSLYDRAYDDKRAAACAPWLAALRERLALGGPRLPGRGVLAASYNIRRRAAALTSDPLIDAWTLALLATLEPELTRTLATRHWPATARITENGPGLTLAFSYVLAIELGEAERAAALHKAIEVRLDPVEDDCGRRYGGPAAPWVTALVAIGEAGGLGRLLR